MYPVSEAMRLDIMCPTTVPSSTARLSPKEFLHKFRDVRTRSGMINEQKDRHIADTY
jgi:hypothetical protein